MSAEPTTSRSPEKKSLHFERKLPLRVPHGEEIT